VKPRGRLHSQVGADALSVDIAGSAHQNRFLLFVGHEFRETLPSTLFFFRGFNLILFTQRFILEHMSPSTPAFLSGPPVR
jgi:hypothetical protein